jgi:hypothetical protein
LDSAHQLVTSTPRVDTKQVSQSIALRSLNSSMVQWVPPKLETSWYMRIYGPWAKAAKNSFISGELAPVLLETRLIYYDVTSIKVILSILVVLIHTYFVVISG